MNTDSKLSPNLIKVSVVTAVTTVDNRTHFLNEASRIPNTDLIDEANTSFEDLLHFLDNKVFIPWNDNFITSKWVATTGDLPPYLLSALLAYVDVEKISHLSSLYAYAGMIKNNSAPNPTFHDMCRRIGLSFEMKASANSHLFYPRQFRTRVTHLQNLNDELSFSSEAANLLSTGKFNETADFELYQQGVLPNHRILEKARSWIIRVFLSHFLEVFWYENYKERIPNDMLFMRGTKPEGFLTCPSYLEFFS